jgi:hypothetical protein
MGIQVRQIYQATFATRHRRAVVRWRPVLRLFLSFQNAMRANAGLQLRRAITIQAEGEKAT